MLLLMVACTSVCCSQPPANTKPNIVTMDGTRQQYWLGSVVQVLEDTSTTLRWHDVLQPKYQAQFKPVRGSYPNFSYTFSAYWLRLSIVAAPHIRKEQWLIAAYYPSLEYVEYHFITPNGNHLSTYSGATVPLAQKVLQHRYHLAPLPVWDLLDSLHTGDTLHLLVRVASRMTAAVPLELITERRLLEQERVEMIPVWLYFGIVFAMLCYNGFLWIALRDRAYLFYVLYIAFYGAFMFVSVNALVFQYAPTFAPLVPSLVTWTNLGGNVMALLFAEYFLRMNKILPRWNRVVMVVLALQILALAVHWWIPVQLMHRWLNVIAIVVVLTMLSSSILALRTGYRPAVFFLAGWAMFLTGGVVFILSNLSLLPKTPIVQYSIQIGSAAEMLLLSLALADRIRLIRKEREEAQTQALQGEIYRLRAVELASANEEIQRQKEILEEQARDIEVANTQLQHQNEQLLLLDRERNELMGIAAHDLKNPLNYIRNMADMLMGFGNEMSDTDKTTFLRQIVLSSERMFEIIRNLLDVNAIERGGVTFSPIRFVLNTAVEQACNDYRSRAEEKSIVVHLDAAESVEVYADKHAVEQVLDNLISNAVKYSPHGKNVYVRCSVQRRAFRDDTGNTLAVKTALVTIQDEGPGLTDDDKEKLFGKFARLSAQPTGGEHSTGLGLSIVKKLVEGVNGKVWCESEFGKGATFFVELPSP